MNPLIQLKHTISLFATALLLACCALAPLARAVVPPPDGGYPGENTAEGQSALLSLTTGTFDTAIGWLSFKSNISGNYNTGVGDGTLVLNTSDQNTATGAAALLLNTTGFRNTANGAFALLHNNAADNTAIGNAALFSNTIGSGNTATGNFALVSNDVGSNNTVTGNGALSANTTGTHKTAVGDSALQSNADGGSNTAIGRVALHNFTTGSNNTAIGFNALGNSTSGYSNTVLGATAGGGIITASGVICINGNGGNVDNTTWIENIYGVTTQNGTTAPVIVSDTGQLGTVASSERFKKDISTMEHASEVILSLRPVSFHYKSDAKGTPQFGLIAEEVAKLNPALVLSDKEGKPFTVRYDAVNAMLLNEFLKEHKTIQEQGAMITELMSHVARQEATIAHQQNQIEALTAGLHKVIAEIKMSKTERRIVLNDSLKQR